MPAAALVVDVVPGVIAVSLATKVCEHLGQRTFFPTISGLATRIRAEHLGHEIGIAADIDQARASQLVNFPEGISQITAAPFGSTSVRSMGTVSRGFDASAQPIGS